MTLYLKVHILKHKPTGLVQITEETITSIVAGTTCQGAAIQQRFTGTYNQIYTDAGVARNFAIKNRSGTISNLLTYKRLFDATWNNLTNTKLSDADIQGLVWLGRRVYYYDRLTTPDHLLSYEIKGSGAANFDDIGTFAADPDTVSRRCPAWNGRDMLEAMTDSGGVISAFSGTNLQAIRMLSLLESQVLGGTPSDGITYGSEIRGLTFNGRDIVALWVYNGVSLGAGDYEISFFRNNNEVYKYSLAVGSITGLQYLVDIDFDGFNYYVFFVVDV